MKNTNPSNYRGQCALRTFPLAAILITIAMAIPTFAQPGSLDPTFDGDGKRVDTFMPDGRGNDEGRSVLIQPDGKIVTVGHSTYGNSFVCSASRHFADGTLDPTFGSGGKVLMDPAFSIMCRSAALQNDGKIVVAGYSYSSSGSDFALVRFNSNGSLDTTFDADGMVTTDIDSSYDYAYSVVIQPDGKIVAAGVSDLGSNIRFALARYNTVGSLDPTFDADGKLTTTIGSYNGYAHAVAVQPDGKIVAAGGSPYNCDPDNGCYNSDVALTRYNTDGSLDTTFDGDGIVTTSIGSYSGANAVAIQPDGKIVAAGYGTPASDDFALVRYNTNGSLDTTFDVDGIVTTPIGTTYESASAVALQPDGKIVAAGLSYNDYDSDFALVRYNSNGSLDTTFDGDGIVTTPIGTGYNAASAVAVQPDGKIVAAGSYNNAPTGSDFAVVRFNPNGSLDASGFNGGIVSTDIGYRGLSGRAVAVQPDGKIVAAGYTYNGAIDFAIVRYNTDGSLDTTFDTDGRVTTDVASYDDYAIAVVVQPDGKIVAAGSGSNGSDSNFALVRYNADGSLDTTFDSDGIVTTQIGTGYDSANAVVIQPDGKIIAAGIGRALGVNGDDFALVRYNTNGSLDTTFDGDGIVTTNRTNDGANAVALQPDGKIVAAGYSYNSNGNPEFCLVRYNPGGALDSTFDGDGIVTTRVAPSFGSAYGAAYAVAIQPDKKIVAAGYSYYNSTSRFALARYNPDGSPDRVMNWSGYVTTSLGDAYALAIQPDKRIVVAGYYDGDFALARHNTNGSLDTTFGGGDGETTVDFDNSSDGASGMALDGQGRAVVLGNSNGGLALARFFLSHKAPFDFDGDGRSDLSVFRPSDSVWYLNRSTQGFAATRFGLSTDKIVPADYDGDGKADIAVFREGTWWRINSSNSTVQTVQFGIPGDIPVPGDYNGDGRDELAVYRNGEWWSEGVARIDFGLSTDKPVPADYDGDGRTDIAVYRDGSWRRINSSDGAVEVEQFGIATDRPVTGDYDGDSKADLAVYRDGTWYLQQSTAGFGAFQWGLPFDIPTAGDYDGDGKTDAAVYRDGVWYLLQSTGGISIQQFGLAPDLPVPSAYSR